MRNTNLTNVTPDYVGRGCVVAFPVPLLLVVGMGVCSCRWIIELCDTESLEVGPRGCHGVLR